MWVKVKEGQQQGHWVEGVEKRPGEVFWLDVELGDDDEGGVPADLADRLEEAPPPEDAEQPEPPEDPVAQLQLDIMDLMEPTCGQPNRGLVRFGGTAEAGINITLTATIIDEPGSEEEQEIQRSLVYQEADTADAAAGVWTNGTTAAQGATSFAAAVNGDQRREPPDDPDEDPDYVFGVPVRAMVLADGVSVLLFYCYSTLAATSREDYSTGPVDVTTTSPGNVVVEDMTGGYRQEMCKSSLRRHAVTPLDVLATQIVVPLPTKPRYAAILPWMSATGAQLAPQPTGLLTVAEDPSRMVYTFAGATNPAAGNVLNVLVHGGD